MYVSSDPQFLGNGKLVNEISCFTQLLILDLQDPFLRISRAAESGGSIPICKTEVVNNNLNPTWKPLCLTMQQFMSKVIVTSRVQIWHKSSVYSCTSMTNDKIHMFNLGVNVTIFDSYLLVHK